MKTCRKCGSSGPFYRDSSRPDGYSYWCKECTSKRINTKRRAHPEKHRKQSREYRKNNPERSAKSTRDWGKRHPEKLREYEQRYRKRHPERAKAKAKTAYEKEKLMMSPKRQDQKLRGRLKKYGITLEEYRNKVEAQNGKCVICGAKGSGKNGNQRLHVDHDHKTRVVRDLLCHKCNAVLGHADDDIVRLLGAASYLIRHRMDQTTSERILQPSVSLQLKINDAVAHEYIVRAVLKEYTEFLYTERNW